MKYIVDTFSKQKELFKLKKIYVYILFSFCAVAFIVHFVYSMEYGSYTATEIKELLVISPDVGYKLYYYIQHSGLYVLLYIFLIFIIPNLYTINFISQKNNNFTNYQITRLGYKYNMEIETFFIFLSTFIYVVLLNIFICVIIHVFYFQFQNSFYNDAVYDMTRMICSNQLLNIIIYILLSSIGYGLFASLIYNMQVFVKNTYVFRGLGLILGILLYTLPAIVASSISIYFFRLFIGSLYLPYILNPGIVYMPAIGSNPLLLFLLGIIMYSVLCLFLMKLRFIKEHKNE